MITRRRLLTTGRFRQAITNGRIQAPGIASPSSLTSAWKGYSDLKPAQSEIKPEGKELKERQTAEESLLSASQTGAQRKSQSLSAKKKTTAELDEELRVKLEGVSGEGGSAGIEYEGGKAEGLKRGVKANMFRVI